MSSKTEAMIAQAIADAQSAEKRREYDLADLPIEPQTWHVLVQPYEPKEETGGGIVLPGAVNRANQILSPVARILWLGPQAHEGKSISGIELSTMNLTVDTYVIVQPYTGVEIKMKDGYPSLKLILNSNIIGKLRWEPERFLSYAG